MTKTNPLSPVGQVVRDIVTALVDFPEDVEVTEIVGEQATVLEVSTRRVDHGRVIGKSGRLADAIREILACHTGIHKHRYVLVVLDDESSHARSRPLRPALPPDPPDPIFSTQSLLIQVVKGIVDDRSSVRVQLLNSLRVTVFEIQVAPQDFRRVIGTKGRTATALRELLVTMGSRAGKRFLLEVVEE